MPVPAQLAITALMFERNQAMLAKGIDGLANEQWKARPQDSCNCALWIVGHIVWARSRTLKLLGVEWSAPWLKFFERGSNHADAPNYPPAEELLAAWKETTISLPSALASVSPETISAPAPTPSPSLDGTIGGMVSFLALHEGYHIGQIVYLRKLVADC